MKIAIFHELDHGGARRTVEEIAKRLRKEFVVDLYYVNQVKDHAIDNILVYSSAIFT
ncbi:hypothetical protein HY041_03380 [Candidatus Roizmanbacteria bacterium]|nr:hypothetical protein [Candidatus Roizmanbacteria bacterium]